VADITSARFGNQSVNKFSQGITLVREPTVSVLIEQVDEVVYAYELGDLLMNRKLHTSFDLIPRQRYCKMLQVYNGF
jgi:hypothetical protein